MSDYNIPLFFLVLSGILGIFLYYFFTIDKINPEKIIKNTTYADVTYVATSGTIVLSSELDLTEQDQDGDNLSSYDELEIYKTNPENKDTDGDGYDDMVEIENDFDPLLNAFIDTDKDSITDQDEIKIYHTNTNKQDTDGDGFADFEEIKNGYSPIIYFSGPSQEIIEINNNKQTSSGLPILMYHYIKEQDKDKNIKAWNLSLDPKVFAEQMKYLSDNGYTTIHFADLKKNIPRKSIILSFDDGYEDFYINAMPILKQYKYTASIAVITGKIGKSGYMNIEQIKECGKYDIEILSHTINHPDLTILTDSQIEFELSESKKLLEKAINKQVETFVYPVGKYNDGIVKLVMKTGYNFAATTEYGVANTENHSKFLFPRIRIDNRDSFRGFAWKLK